MTASAKLAIVKTIHTIIWCFFNAVIFYLLYAVLTGRIDVWLWAGLGIFLVEAIVLKIYKMSCPLTLIARKYSSSTKENFDIYLPNWLAKYNKAIYTGMLVIIILILCYKLWL